MKMTKEDKLEALCFYKSRGMTVEQVAEKMGVHRTTLSKKLNGETEFSTFDLMQSAALVAQHQHGAR